MKRNKISILIFILFFSSISIAQVDPEIRLGARGVMSVNNDIINNSLSSAINDFSDSGFLLGFKQKLYNDFRGLFVLGFQFPDAESDLGQIFFHQIFLQIEDKNNIFKLGRSRVKSSLIEFTTLRDDDALQLTDVISPYSNGINTEDNQFGNVFEYSHIFKQRYWLTIHGEHFTKSKISPETDFSMNALGFSLEYRVPLSQRWNREIIQQIGFSFNNFLTESEGYSNKFNKTLKNYIFSAVFNLLPDPVYFLDFRMQSILNTGTEGIASVSGFSDLARAKSVSVFGGPRFLYRRLERPYLQASIYGGYKSYPDLVEKTSQLQLVTNFFYRLGENFDVGIQYQYKKNIGEVAKIYPNNEHRIQFSIVYSIEQVWNKHFDDRESILNLEHGYIK
ncbi:hypothetical protein ACSSWA_05785 [Melioribacter sp. Ez-97]|uniref:hypothetical protein n=1 Tax=Melioribacter sp. Ez-97 TaxID=3423434 RepID=UPI003EDB1169